MCKSARLALLLAHAGGSAQERRLRPNLETSFWAEKVLASKFDFTPFQKHHEKSSPSQELQPKDHHQPAPAADHGSAEIDPRYGVEKRLVPTGPNPLHH
ncbi:hypothetical protein CUMW_101690 [Citrus unshiu]|nr:hypothetical protein CUMW_101690 [Citrus unshiu]